MQFVFKQLSFPLLDMADTAADLLAGIYVRRTFENITELRKFVGRLTSELYYPLRYDNGRLAKTYNETKLKTELAKIDED